MIKVADACSTVLLL